MTQAISTFIQDKTVLDNAVQFLVTEYGIQIADIRIQQDSDDIKVCAVTLSVDVNDDEVDEIQDALVAIGAVLRAGDS